jgi:hypothetical protein
MRHRVRDDLGDPQLRIGEPAVHQRDTQAAEGRASVGSGVRPCGDLNLVGDV